MAFKCAGKCLKISSDILRRHLNSPLSHYPRLYLSDAVSFTARTNTCGSLRHCDVGKPVRLCGWIQYQRMGGKFLIIRDWQGLTQLFIPENKKSLASQISSLSYETVVEVTGTVRPRPDGQENKQMDTGDIEVEVEELQVLNMATPDLPFQIKDQNVNEALRMECRYLDIRTKQMQRNLRLRSKMIMKMREFLTNKHEFVDVETPTLFRRTPGGAKEFVVPSRQKGKFYSLPQSPQQFKQLLMVGGIDRYFQIARCYRDEGAKPDRQPEFTQLDLEMSFVDREGVIGLMEQMMAYCWPEHKPALETPFPRLTYEQAMRLYGVDKPDTRFDMKLYDVTTQLRNCGAQVLDERSCLEDGTIVAFKLCDRERNISNSELKQLRKEALDRLNDTKSALLPVRIDENGDWLSTISKHLTTQTQKTVTMELDLQPGDLVVIAAGQKYAPHECLGKLRLMVADHLENEGVSIRDKESYNFLWVVDFPMFLPKETGYGLESAHHPFTDVHPEDRHLLHTAPHQVRGQHYDLVLNGNEVGGGSIRIHNPEDQRYILETILKEDASELEHLLKAFTMGCPPHGGIALGLDRLFAVVCGATSIRDVIAFPKSADSKDLMSRAPAAITQSELDLYHIQVKQEEP